METSIRLFITPAYKQDGNYYLLSNLIADKMPFINFSFYTSKMPF